MKSVFPNFQINLILAVVFGFLMFSPTPLLASSETGDDPAGLLHQPPMGAEHGGQHISNFFGVLAGTRGAFWKCASLECEKYGWGRLAVYFLLGQVLTFLATWGITKFIAREYGTLRNNAFYYLYSILAGGVFLAAAYGCFLLQFWAGLVVALLAIVVVGFVVTMKMFCIGFWRTIGFLLLRNIATSVASAAVSIVIGQGKPLPWLAFASMSPEQQKAAVLGVNGMTDHTASAPETPATSSAASPAPASRATAPTGPADLQGMYSRLQAERTTLDTNDAAAVEQFNQRAAEYTALNHRIANSVAPRPAPSPAPAKRPVKIAH